jgi:transposase
VEPHVKSNKNDFLDAEAIAEALDRQSMRFVPIKTDDQLDLQALHRVRDRLIARRTSVIAVPEPGRERWQISISSSSNRGPWLLFPFKSICIKE